MLADLPLNATLLGVYLGLCALIDALRRRSVLAWVQTQALTPIAVNRVNNLPLVLVTGEARFDVEATSSSGEKLGGVVVVTGWPVGSVPVGTTLSRVG